jgi:outer membrane PBP1 activator LpoA protein
MAGGLGKPLTMADVLKAGFTKAEIARCRRVNEVSEAFGFDTMMKTLLEAKDRAELLVLQRA